MSLPQLAVRSFATPGDYISHLGPRPLRREDEGALTLCGLFLAPMKPVPPAKDAGDELRSCALCADLADSDVWTVERSLWVAPQPSQL